MNFREVVTILQLVVFHRIHKHLVAHSYLTTANFIFHLIWSHSNEEWRHLVGRQPLMKVNRAVIDSILHVCSDSVLCLHSLSRIREKT